MKFFQLFKPTRSKITCTIFAEVVLILFYLMAIIGGPVGTPHFFVSISRFLSYPVAFVALIINNVFKLMDLHNEILFMTVVPIILLLIIYVFFSLFAYIFSKINITSSYIKKN